MKVPILNGVFTDASGDVRTSYPRNLVPVPGANGLNTGYMRPAAGIIPLGGGTSGVDRGAIEWKGRHFRVVGNRFVEIDSLGGATTLYTFPGGSVTPGRARFAFGFDNLAISYEGGLYYYYGTGPVVQVIDVDLGVCLDVVWQGGYFISTDGEFLVTTELNDPTQVSTLKYGSAESDPDPVKGLAQVRNEVYAFGRYSVEVFQNVGGAGFPYAVVQGATVTRGAVGRDASAQLGDTWAFVGGGRNEPLSVWGINGGASQRIATREIDKILAQWSENVLSESLFVESRTFEGHEWLYLHLPDRTMVYDLAASTALGEPVWFELGSSLTGHSRYLASGFTWVYNQWWCGHPVDGRIGVESGRVGDHWGQPVGWQFDTVVLYGEGRGVIVHELELIALTGRAPVGETGVIWNSYSNDGVTWSNERAVRAGSIGQTTKRLVWRGQGRMFHWRTQRFRGTSETHTTPIRLEIRGEALGG